MSVAEEARQIVASLFQNETGLGVLRLREHPLSVPNLDIARFLAVLGAVFPPAQSEEGK